jgi:LDH2 family malate/lactate/ureidoglycolate dehydrogenase
MIILEPEELRKLGREIFSSQGATFEKASLVSDTCVEANLTGHDSHGVRYFVIYSQRIKEGWIDPVADPEIIKESSSHALIDGKWTFGQVTAMKLIEKAVEKAKKNVVGVVGAKRCNHIGRLGYFSQWVASKGLIGIILANVNNPLVSVHNGLGRAFGTNPLCISIPTKEGSSILVDFATSVVAHGKISVAKAEKIDIPRNWVRDKYGRETEDPSVMWDGGWLLPFGEYKGYGLQLVSEVLGGILTGSLTGFDDIENPPSTNGVLGIVINPEAFLGLEDFFDNTHRMVSYIKSFESVNGEEIVIPGEPEQNNRRNRTRDGIPIPEETWRDIVNLAKDLNIDARLALKS